jgi:hypothetical protein
MQIEGGGSVNSKAAAAAAAAAAAVEAARRAAEARAKAAAEAAAKAAAEAAAKAAAEAAAQRAEAAKDKAPTTLLGKFSEKAKEIASAATDALPWDKAGSAFSQVKDFVADFAKADQAKTDKFMEKHGDALGESGRAGVEKLAGDGALSAIDKEWGNLRDNLAGYMQSEKDPKVATAVVEQLSNPDAIAQMTENGCAAATLQKALAESNPGQYFQIATDLATTGKATLPNGDKLAVSKENQKAIDSQEMPIGDRINAAFQAAAMDFANGSHQYSAADDRSHEKTEDTELTYAGLNISQATKLNEALLGTPTLDQEALKNHIFDTIDAQADKPQEDKVSVDDMLMENVKSQFDQAKDGGAPGIFVSLHSGSERIGPRGLDDAVVSYHHMVMVKDMDAKGNVTIVDANGLEAQMSKAEFASKVSQSNEADAYGGIGNTGTMAATTTTTTTTTRRR